MYWRGRPVVPGSGPFIVGVLNVTPDSFSDGGLHATAEAAIAAGLRMADEGADVLDVGGESTRPGSDPVPADEQIRRTGDVIAALSQRFGRTGPAISIDTRAAPVAEAALDAGATIINDISALRDDPDMAGLVASRRAGVVLMHMKGTPATMQVEPQYENVVAEVTLFLRGRVEAALAAGIARSRLIVDPGIGFGKTADHNLALLGDLTSVRPAGTMLLVGPSRKAFIGRITGQASPASRLYGTLGAVAACILQGAECVRVHDVGPARQAADVCAAIRQGGIQ